MNFKKRLICGTFCLILAIGSGLSAPKKKSIQLHPIGRYAGGGAEISAYDANSQRLFITNGDQLDVLNIQDPTTPTGLFQIDLSGFGDGVTSVAAKDGYIAVAVTADPKTDPGKIVFFDSDGNLINAVTAGSLPDMVTFTPNGEFLLVANEGEPEGYCEGQIDPEGSISIIDLTAGVPNLMQSDVRTADFTSFNDQSLPGIRIFGPKATVAQDLEPEYITVSQNSRYAWVSLQENNALAIVDIKKAQVIALTPLGYKDHFLTGFGLDPSDRDSGIEINTWPVRGMFQPDGIASYRPTGLANPTGTSVLNGMVDGTFKQTFIVSANEGDAREYSCLVDPNDTDEQSEDFRIEDLSLDPAVFTNADFLKEKENLGRLEVSVFEGLNSTGDYEALYSFGARSFSIWSSEGALVWDSGDDFEQITAALIPDYFNSNNDVQNSFDSRSDAKGPEPEGLILAQIRGKTYAFIGLERVGGVMVYDISDPYSPEFVEYTTTRDFDAPLPDTNSGPEGLLFIEDSESPSGDPLLIVTYEESGSIQIFEIHSK